MTYIKYINRYALIHQTSPENAEKILSSQEFLASSQGLFGPFVYFAKTLEQTDKKAHKKGTYLIADVYLGKTIEISKLDCNKIDFKDLMEQGFDSIIGCDMPTGKEYIIFDPKRIHNIKYAYGTKPQKEYPINRTRIVLFYVTSQIEASKIHFSQMIPKSSGPFGSFIYMYDSITDALAVNKQETYLAADVDIKNIYVHRKDTAFNINLLPAKYDGFKVKHNGIFIYGFKNCVEIKNIHHCGGTKY